MGSRVSRSHVWGVGYPGPMTGGKVSNSHVWRVGYPGPMPKGHSASRALDVRKTRRITTEPQLA